ncbi:MAG: flagellar hook-basal body complex protein [Firmicutes bacterium]|nr:flagellar hook-basal body complex protein [[Eubacterium] siraeum]MCM1486945.1 flagellar hook-basal body complex protein [Bacillota bacterium]
MMKSLYSGVAGLKVHNQRMDVIGNNISNVNTTAYKASTVTFKDIFYQNKSYGSSGDVTKGGTNANQVGYGASLGAIQQVMTQSGLTYSDSPTDCAIYGEGFFQVMDQAGNIYYTRNGQFHIDNAGNLCDPSGNIVLGVSGDPTGVDASSQRINLYVPPVDNNAASVTKTFKTKDGGEYEYTVSVADYGPDGNMSITITGLKDGEVPFATKNGSMLTVKMDLEQGFASQDEFQEAFAAAVRAGGVELPAGDISFQFNELPLETDIPARIASNRLENFEVGGENMTIGFATRTPGEFGNGYEINVVASGTATEPKAKWSSNVLTITIPRDGASQQDVQDAIDEAAGTNEKRQIDITDWNLTGAAQAQALISTNTRLRIGLIDGKDNFFQDFAESMGTIKLTDGRFAAEQTTQDLENIYIDDDGVIYGVHTVHGTIAMGRIDLVTFENPMGLEQEGTSYWVESLSSGVPQVKRANDTGTGSVVAGALEMSNTDLAQEISDMIITQRGFQANSRIITVSDTMLEELVNLKR